MFTILALWGMTARGYLRSAMTHIADERGQDMVEYALVIGVVSLGVVAAFIWLPWADAFTALVNTVGCQIGGVGTVIGTHTCT
jgi:Flp pilus assembly pilin Flp